MLQDFFYGHKHWAAFTNPVVLSPDLLNLLLDAVLRNTGVRLRPAALAGRVQHLQASEILRGIQQAVGMINTQSGDAPFSQELADQTMRVREHLRVFHTQAHKVVDIEKAPVVDFFCRNSPVRQAIRLLLQQAMQGIEAAAVAGLAIAGANGAIDDVGHLR